MLAVSVGVDRVCGIDSETTQPVLNKRGLCRAPRRLFALSPRASEARPTQDKRQREEQLQHEHGGSLKAEPSTCRRKIATASAIKQVAKIRTGSHEQIFQCVCDGLSTYLNSVGHVLEIRGEQDHAGGGLGDASCSFDRQPDIGGLQSGRIIYIVAKKANECVFGLQCLDNS